MTTTELDINAVYEALDELEDLRLSIDDDVRQFAGETAAIKAKQLYDAYQKTEKDLQKQLMEQNAPSLDTDDYGLDEQGNKAVTEAMDDVVKWFDGERARLIEALEARMRATVGQLRTQGISVDAQVRDAMYEVLVDEEVIEQWEPLEF